MIDWIEEFGISIFVFIILYFVCYKKQSKNVSKIRLIVAPIIGISFWMFIFYLSKMNITIYNFIHSSLFINFIFCILISCILYYIPLINLNNKLLTNKYQLLFLNILNIIGGLIIGYLVEKLLPYIPVSSFYYNIILPEILIFMLFIIWFKHNGNIYKLNMFIVLPLIFIVGIILGIVVTSIFMYIILISFIFKKCVLKND